MKDDYLWDGTGEPDPDVEKLEQVLVRYRYQARPLSPALSSQLSWQRRTTIWVGVRVAAAAAVILMLLAGLWIFRVQQKSVTNPPESAGVNSTGEQPIAPAKEASPGEISIPKETVKGTVAQRAPRKSYQKAFRKLEPPDIDPGVESGLASHRQPIMIPFINVETARHLEQAQLLLLSFRNTRDAEASTDPDLDYDKQRSRGLLYRNILLRRDAEARGNLPTENLLGTLEPFLLDIANLPDRPTTDDVRAIKERMQRNEIVSALQIYSAPISSRLF